MIALLASGRPQGWRYFAIGWRLSAIGCREVPKDRVVRYVITWRPPSAAVIDGIRVGAPAAGSYVARLRVGPRNQLLGRWPLEAWETADSWSDVLGDAEPGLAVMDRHFATPLLALDTIAPGVPLQITVAGTFGWLAVSGRLLA